MIKVMDTMIPKAFVQLLSISARSSSLSSSHHICRTRRLPKILQLKQFSTSWQTFYPRGINPRLRGSTSTSLKDSDAETIKDEELHQPVMLAEVMDFFEPSDNQVYLDMTFGGGGHTRALLDSNPTIKVYALDRDPVAFKLAEQLASKYSDRLHPLLGKWTELKQVLSDHGVSENGLDGALIDAGCSSMQFDDGGRGFAFSLDGPLDMRMDGDRFASTLSAADVVNRLDEENLSRIIKTYGEEKQHKKIARLIAEYRKKYKPIETTQELATIISYGFTHTAAQKNKDKLGRRVHVATRTFQALRIFVNDELNELHNGLEIVSPFLKVGGKLAVLSFHSLEDRVVKRFLYDRDVNEKGMSIRERRRSAGLEVASGANKDGHFSKWEILNKKVLTPTEFEISENPRARSAKLRIAKKLEA